MLDFLMEGFDFLTELAFCEFDFEKLLRYRLRSLRFAVLLAIAVLPLYAGIVLGSWFWILIGIQTTGFVVWKGIRYSIWWFREGHLGGAYPEEDTHTPLDDIPLPRGDIMEQLPEDEQLRGKLEDSHRCLNSRM